MSYSTIIGDSQPTAVSCPVAAFPFSLVTQADIEEADSAVNNALVSGKKKGACFLMTTTTGSYPVLVCAMGSTKTSTWVTVDVTTRVIYTPA